MSGWFDEIPIYVTRKNAHGVIGQLTIGAFWAVLILMLVSFNLILWGAYGVFEVIRLWVNA